MVLISIKNGADVAYEYRGVSDIQRLVKLRKLLKQLVRCTKMVSLLNYTFVPITL